MSNTVIRLEDVSKQYRLGTIGTGTLASDLKRWIYRFRGKSDPFLKIGEENDRTKKGSSDYVWALKDVSFDIQRGDVVGVIGKNGAGKSTLLKLLSRTTLPTTGNIKVRGRIASLLEVGTGFHPELTGRENIFLNGAILGMRKREILEKFDEIVDFAGVDRYIDTPVKRYSSGMYVRLAFAVAAHLDPEILIVDEVLAVGDAEFQKKALGKMSSVSKGEGRTVLFVSHNIGAIKTLCHSGIVMQNGRLLHIGEIEAAVKTYLDNGINATSRLIEPTTSRCGRFQLLPPYITNPAGHKAQVFAFGEELTLSFPFKFQKTVPKINVGFAIVNNLDQRIFTSHLTDDKSFSFGAPLSGDVTISTGIHLPSLAPGTYRIIYGVRNETEELMIMNESGLTLEINQTFSKETGNGILWHTTNWKIEK